MEGQRDEFREPQSSDERGKLCILKVFTIYDPGLFQFAELSQAQFMGM